MRANKSKVSTGGIIMGANGELLALEKKQVSALLMEEPEFWGPDQGVFSQFQGVVPGSKHEENWGEGWWCLIASRAGSSDCSVSW